MMSKETCSGRLSPGLVRRDSISVRKPGSFCCITESTLDLIFKKEHWARTVSCLFVAVETLVLAVLELIL